MDIHMESNRECSTQDRTALREQMNLKRLALSEKQVQEYSARVINKLTDLYPIRMAKSLMAFVSVRNEVDLRSFIQRAQEAGKQVYLPRVESNGQLVPVLFTEWANCRKSAYGILEPIGEAASAEQIDVVLVPGLVYDAGGYRLGYGKGYYDKFLATLNENTFKCGVCYDFQVAADTFPHALDIPVHWIVTEKSELAVDYNFF